MKKTLTGIIAGISLLGMVGCGSLQKLSNPPTQKTVVIQQKASLDQIVETVYCVRAKTTYQVEGSKEEEKEISTGHGSAFAYRRTGGDTYLITNQHVVGKKEYAKIVMEMENDKEGNPMMKLKIKRYKRKSVELTLIDSYTDKNPQDDIPLDLIYDTGYPDLAVLRTKKDIKDSRISRLSQGINLLDSSYYGDSNTLRWGEPAYLIGYPMARFRFVSKGSIGNPGKKYTEGQPIYAHDVLLDLTANPGNSGGPFFVKRGDDYYWMGIVESVYFNSWGESSHVVSAIKANDVRKVADKAILEDITKKK